MNSLTIIGIDPGQSGGIARWVMGGMVGYKMPETERDIYDTLITCHADDASAIVYIESVHSFPGQGVASSFKFGQGYGFLRGLITALGVRVEHVSPQKWQKYYGLKPRSQCPGSTDSERARHHKHLLKAKAQQLFPKLDVTLATCDALLIAHYGYLIEK